MTQTSHQCLSSLSSSNIIQLADCFLHDAHSQAKGAIRWGPTLCGVPLNYTLGLLNTIRCNWPTCQTNDAEHAAC